jgi:hypothetical protein
LILFLATLNFFAQNTYEASLKYEKEYQKYAKTKSFEQNLENSTKHLLNSLFKVLLNNQLQTSTATNIKDDMIQINKYKAIVQINLQYFIITLLLSLFLYFVVAKTIFLLYIHIVSLLTLFFGVNSPIFLLYIEKNIAGSDVILQFESSTVLSSIEKLFLQDNYFVGGIILLFSILFPIVKTIISSCFILFTDTKILNKLSNFSSSISKFSMADVFVLSIFLVYLSPKSDGIIKAQLEVGFYFFFIYVVLSLFTGLLIKNNCKIGT